MGELQERKELLFMYLKEKKEWITYILLGIIAITGYWIRTRNLDLLQGKYPIALDPYVFLRYVKYVVEHGQLMVNDMMRYYPIGYTELEEFRILTYFVVYLYKILHALNPSITVEQAHILYPPIAFVIGLIFFFLFVRKAFNWVVALISSVFLTVVPIYLYRTMAGFSDKEALAMVFLFMALYFYISAIKEKEFKKYLTYGILAGATTGFLGLVWGGVNFVFLSIGSYALILILLDKFKKQEFYIHISWGIVASIVLMLGFYERYNPNTLVGSLTSGIMILSLLAGAFHYLFMVRKVIDVNKWFKKDYPDGIVSFIILTIVGFISLFVIYGPIYFTEKLQSLYINLVEPFGTTRWALTVAESHQPYFVDWVSQLGLPYILMFILGSILLFYQLVKKLDAKYKLTAIYTAFIFMFLMSRYRGDSVFNGVTLLSQIVYMGSLIAFFVLIIYGYLRLYYQAKKENKNIHELLNFDQTFVFIFFFFLFTAIGARSAARLMFPFAPATAILAGYFLVSLVDTEIKVKTYKIIVLAIVLYLGLTTAFEFFNTTSNQAKYTGPSFNGQWQQAMSWVQDNTPEESVFAHWWDYGYWVQTGGNRATISDGGNARGAINHFVGRYLLTAQDDQNALQLLKTHGVSYVLMIKDEIGKYPAFSSIGADENYDRYSWIPTYSNDYSRVQETRNQTIYFFTGGSALDDDFVYNGVLVPGGSAGLLGFFLPVETIDNQTSLKQPQAVIAYKSQQVQVPVECLYIENRKIIFPEKGLDACIRILPKIDSGKVDQLGAALYLSPDVSKSLFARLFLMNEENPYFELVYNDESQLPLAYYQGNLIGPLKIWEVHYPENVLINETYLLTTLPNPDVEKVRK